MSVLIFLIVLYILLGLSMMKLFEKAGVPGWKALVPGVAAVEWCKIIGRKPQYALWLLFPVVNIFIYAGMCVDMVRSFAKHSFWQSALAVIYAPIPFYLIGKEIGDKYQGPILEKERSYHKQYAEAMEKKDKAALMKLDKEFGYMKKSQTREWTESIVFAVFAAAFIRMFLIEAYVIPTSSMEGTLKVGDYLFVSKAHYGMRMPMTVLQFPLLHNQLPFGNKESYLKEPSLPYFRLPALEKIDNNDPVVFNWPVGDSVIITPERSYDIGTIRRQSGGAIPPRLNILDRPIDKKDHYIKRCVGLPGDSLAIRDGQVYINGKAAQNPTHIQFSYYITPPNNAALNKMKLDELGVSMYDIITPANGPGYYNLNQEQIKKIEAAIPGVKVERRKRGPEGGYLFPFDLSISGKWTVDDYGTIYIPKKGVTTPLTLANLPYYERIISVYEGNQLAVRDGKIFINNQEASSYTFKQDYFWMMGDNRHNSEDSRFWGYVPEDHIVGKPLFIWFSTKAGNMGQGINWNRIFTSATKL